MPATVIREIAHAFARAPRAMICWTLGITEHHNAVDNVLSLINLALLTGHVGRWGSGLNPLRGQNNVQGGGDMGALPDRLPGFQHVENDAAARAGSSAAWGLPIPPKTGLQPDRHVRRDGARRAARPLRDRREPDALRGRPDTGPGACSTGSTSCIVQDILHDRDRRDRRRRAPRLGLLVRVGGHGHLERAPRAARAQGARRRRRGAKDDLEILYELARRLGRDWGRPDAEAIWNELRALSPMHAGMSYARLEAEDGLQWPCSDESHPGELFLHARLWERPVVGPRAPFSVVEHDPPVDRLTEEFPLRLTTGRRLEEYNTGVQTAGYASPTRRGETLDLAPEDAARLGVGEGERVRIVSRRGSVEAPVHIDPALRPGLVLHDLPLPRGGGDQPADDRGERPQGGHRRVQGRGDPGRERLGPAADGSRRIVRRRTPAADDERAAVDALLGAPPSSWEGGTRDAGAPMGEPDLRVARGGHAARDAATCCCPRSTRCRTASAG